MSWNFIPLFLFLYICSAAESNRRPIRVKKWNTGRHHALWRVDSDDNDTAGVYDGNNNKSSYC